MNQQKGSKSETRKHYRSRGKECAAAECNSFETIAMEVGLVQLLEA